MNPDLRHLIPNGSKSFFEANPQLAPMHAAASEAHAAAKSKAGKRRKEMNKTEERFAAFVLDPKVRQHDYESYEYEGLTLRWPDGMRYTPDFVAIREVVGIGAKYPLVSIVLIEVKGAHQWAKDVVKFRAARDKWGHIYRFEFWTYQDGEWRETR